MRSQHVTKSSGRGEMRTRRGAGALASALACALAILALLGPQAAGAAAPPKGIDAVEALIDAFGAERAERAVNAIGHGLAMMEAQKRIAATERKLAKEAAADTESEAEAEEAPVVEEVEDPAEMPPASAGTNGTTVPHSGGGPGSGKLFAHTRQGDTGSTAILLSGIALAPPDAPEAVQNVINAANTIVGRPYVWGGGHASFYSYGYDCSGSVSFALFGGGLIPEPLTSGALEGWGAPGPGKWITVYANAGHTFMEVAGLRWDTVGDARGTGPRWHLAPASSEGFAVRHPPGL